MTGDPNLEGGDILSTPFDKTRRLPKESLRRYSDDERPPMPPAMFAPVPADPEMVRTPLDKKLELVGGASGRADQVAAEIPRLSGRRRLDRDSQTSRQAIAWRPRETVLQPEPCHGRYPKGFLAWALRELGLSGADVLHVCTGGMTHEDAQGGVRLDLRREAAPDVRADGRRLPFTDATWKAVFIDPPYSIEYARELYGTDYPRPSHLLREAARVVVPCGLIGFLHYLVPVPPEGTRVVSVTGITQGLGYRIRAWTIYQRDQEGLFA